MTDRDIFEDFLDEDLPLAEVVRRKREREKQLRYQEREEEILDTGINLINHEGLKTDESSTELSEHSSDERFLDDAPKVKKYVGKEEKAREKKERKEAKEEGKKSRRKAAAQESSTDDSHPSANDFYLDPDDLWGAKGESVSESSSSYGAIVERRAKKR